MEVRAVSKFVRISPTKVRDLARTIQGLSAADALSKVQLNSRKGAFLIHKTLKSAIANAENNAGMQSESLVVKEAVVDNGPTMKRYQPRARGRAGRITKRMSHITVVLTDGLT